MRAEVLDSPAALDALAPEWDALWRRTERTTPFQSPRWLLPWWQAFGNGCPRVATVRRDGALVGVLAAYILTEAKGRRLLPIGAGTTDYLDVLGEGVEAMLQALLGRAALEGVGRCELIDTPPGSPLRSAPTPVGWAGCWRDGEACPVLLLDRIPAAIRRKLRMNRNRAGRAGGWTVESVDSDGTEAGLEALIRLHQGRWTGEGQAGVLSDPAVLRFHRLAAPGLLAAGMLRLCLLRVGGVAVAATLALLGPGTIYFYLSGYDTEWQFVSPGSLLLGAMLEQAAGEGRMEAHFLRGREGYKYAWGATDRLNAYGCFDLTS